MNSLKQQWGRLPDARRNGPQRVNALAGYAQLIVLNNLTVDSDVCVFGASIPAPSMTWHRHRFSVKRALQSC